MTTTVSAYGSWKSPITAELVGGGEIGLEQIRIDGDDIYWIERRAQEGGRKVIVRRAANGEITDVTPTGFNARTRVHEYGGGDYAVAERTIVFSNFTDQRLYLQSEDAQPRPLTPAPRTVTPTDNSIGEEIFITPSARTTRARAKRSIPSSPSISTATTAAPSCCQGMTSIRRRV